MSYALSNNREPPHWFVYFWLIVFFLLLTFKVFGQPILNQNILLSAQKLVGGKVGNGSCRNFVETILRANEADISLDNIIKERFFATWNSWDWQIDEVYPGDIIWIYNAFEIDYENEKKRSYGMKFWYPNHTAIVSKVLGCDIFEIMQQNSYFEGEMRKYATIDTFDMTSLDGGRIFFFRPYPSTTKASIIWKTASWVAYKRFKKRDR